MKTSNVTTIGDGFSSEDIFVKQAQALGMHGDVTMVISNGWGNLYVIKVLK